MKASSLSVLLLAALLLRHAVAADVVIAGRDGTAPATIVIGNNCTEVERFAAGELQAYVEEISRVKLLIRNAGDMPRRVSGCEILIGSTETNPRLKQVAEAEKLALDREVLGDDGYIIKSVRSDGSVALLLTGSHDRSSLFAVYHLLELCGVGFYGCRERGGEVIPHSMTLAIPPPDIVVKPRMKYRFVSDNNFSATEKTKLVNLADWAAKNRCNAFTITPSRAGETWEQIAVEEVRKRGLMIVGPGHILARMTPDKKLFGVHPEYFPLIKGERRVSFSESWGGAPSFCWSNADAMKLVVGNAAAYVAQNPCIDIFALYPPDGPLRGSQCQCEACAKQSLGDWYLTLINQVAAALPKSRPGVKLMWIAYNECGVPPKVVRPANHGTDMILLWCNDIRNHHEPMDSAANRHAAAYLQWKPRLKGIKTDGLKNPGDGDLAAFHRWRAWSEFLRAGGYAGDVVVLDYYNAHVADSLRIPWLGYCQSGPWPDGVMQKDFQWYASEGIAGWQNCTDYYNDAPNPWWNWLAARLLCDPAADVAALSSKFYGSYYGDVSVGMQSYFTTFWSEIASDEISQAAAMRLEALGMKLNSLVETAGRANDPALNQRMKAALSFHARCVARKMKVLEEYNADGSPKRQPTS